MNEQSSRMAIIAADIVEQSELVERRARRGRDIDLDEARHDAGLRPFRARRRSGRPHDQQGATRPTTTG